MRRAYFAAMLLTIVGCAASQALSRGTVTGGLDEPRRMAAAVLSQSPVGTPIADAQRFMESEGFTCFHDIAKTNPDRLFCDRMDAGASRWVDRRWMVSIICRDGKVVDVSADVGLIGL